MTKDYEMSFSPSSCLLARALLLLLLLVERDLDRLEAFFGRNGEEEEKEEEGDKKGKKEGKFCIPRWHGATATVELR